MGCPGDRANPALIRTGLLGGSFNPAHGAHRQISLMAAKALGLDEVWWVVSPGNPLKPKAGMAPLPVRLRRAQRMARRQALVRHLCSEGKCASYFHSWPLWPS